MSDLIDRQAAIDALSTPHGILYPIRTVEELPSVQSEPKTGWWMEFARPWYQCSECGAVRKNLSFMENYCPNCGAKMEAEE